MSASDSGNAASKDKSSDSDDKAAKYVKDRSGQLKFTYAQQKEYETIDDDIAKLEEAIADLDEQIAANATSYSRLNELMEEKSAKEKELEYKMDRWVFLNDLAEQIVLKKEQ